MIEKMFLDGRAVERKSRTLERFFVAPRAHYRRHKVKMTILADRRENIADSSLSGAHDHLQARMFLQESETWDPTGRTCTHL